MTYTDCEQRRGPKPRQRPLGGRDLIAVDLILAGLGIQNEELPVVRGFHARADKPIVQLVRAALDLRRRAVRMGVAHGRMVAGVSIRKNAGRSERPASYEVRET